MRTAKLKGFTLIELLIVLVIVSLGFSVVAPPLYNTYRKTQVSLDVNKLGQAIEKVSHKAFTANKIITMTTEGRMLQVQSNGTTKWSTEFDHLRFPQQVIKFDRHGFTQAKELLYFDTNERRSFQLSKFSKGTDRS